MSILATQVIRLIEDAGFRVSVFHNPGSLFCTVKPFIEMHAINNAVDPVDQFICRVFTDEHADPQYACACELAALVGIDLED